MLSKQDKQWIAGLLEDRFGREREFMVKFIIEGRKEDREWVKNEIDELARSVAVGFFAADQRFDRIEKILKIPSPWEDIDL